METNKQIRPDHIRTGPEAIAAQSAGLVRYLPAVTFGLRVAALAGLVGGAAFGADAGIDASLGIGLNDTTCCPPDHD